MRGKCSSLIESVAVGSMHLLSSTFLFMIVQLYLFIQSYVKNFVVSGIDEKQEEEIKHIKTRKESL